ncbi:MAG TPA: cell division protein FtsA, partial [Thermodesulfobacteriota bacterium]|nr:cell division protein FtsA [Thermodesulfobacteriota bacterium]
LNFPFSDTNKIEQVYQFELENISTFDPMDKFHGHHIVKTETGSEVIISMFENDHIRDLIRICDDGGVDPKIVTFAPLAFSSINGFLSPERPLILIDIGASRMSFSLFDKEGIKRVRSSSKAGNSVTEHISKILGVSFEEAETMKLDGLVGHKAAIVQEAFGPLLSEMKKTVQFFEMEIKEEIKSVLLAGGTSFMAGINDYVGKELKRDVRSFFISELGDESQLFAQSFALSLYGSALKKGNLNLRKGEFKYTGKNEELRRVFMVPTVLFCVLVLLLLYSAGVEYFEYKDRVVEMEAQIGRTVKQTFPGVKVIPKPVAFMESEVKRVRNQLGLIEGIRGGSTPLEILRNISASIPPGAKLTVNEVNFVDDATIKLLGKCGSYDEVAQIEKALSSSKAFKKVIRDSTETAANNTVKFQISLLLE